MENVHAGQHAKTMSDAHGMQLKSFMSEQYACKVSSPLEPCVGWRNSATAHCAMLEGARLSKSGSHSLCECTATM